MSSPHQNASAGVSGPTPPNVRNTVVAAIAFTLTPVGLTRTCATAGVAVTASMDRAVSMSALVRVSGIRRP